MHDSGVWSLGPVRFFLDIEDYQNNSHQFWMIKIPYLKIVFGENLLCNWSITQASKVDSFLTSNEKSIPALLCRLDLECST